MDHYDLPGPTVLFGIILYQFGIHFEDPGKMAENQPRNFGTLQKYLKFKIFKKKTNFEKLFLNSESTSKFYPSLG